MREVIVKHSQTLVDINLQVYGAVDFRERIIRANGLSGFNAVLLEGQRLKIPDAVTVIQTNTAHELRNVNVASEPSSVVGAGEGIGFGIIVGEDGKVNGLNVPKYKTAVVSSHPEARLLIGLQLTEEQQALVSQGAQTQITFFILNLENLAVAYRIFLTSNVAGLMTEPVFETFEAFERKVLTLEITQNPSVLEREIEIVSEAVLRRDFDDDGQAFLIPSFETLAGRVGFTFTQDFGQIIHLIFWGGIIPAGYHGAFGIFTPSRDFLVIDTPFIRFFPSNFEGALVQFLPSFEQFFHDYLLGRLISTREIPSTGTLILYSIQNQLRPTATKTSFGFNIVYPNNMTRNFEPEINIEPYSVPSGQGIISTLGVFGSRSSIIILTIAFQEGHDRNYILAVTLEASPVLDTGDVLTDLSAIRFTTGQTFYGRIGQDRVLNRPSQDAGLLFYDENLKIARIGRADISEISSEDASYLYTRVQETQTSAQNHLHTFYIGADSDGDINNENLTGVQLRLDRNTGFNNIRSLGLRASISIYNRMKYGEYRNTAFPYYPLLASSITGASTLGINNFNPAFDADFEFVAL